MRNLYSFSRPVVAVSIITLLALAAGCSKRSDTAATDPGPVATAQTSIVAQGKHASKLGDLIAFQSIATDVSKLVDKQDLGAAKARIKDLEVAWDSAEAGLKPQAASDWHVLDKVINSSLEALCGNPVNQVTCKEAMSELLKTFDSLQTSH